MKTIQEISPVLAKFQVEKSAVERDMQIAVTESKLNETILQHEIDLNAAKDALHVLKMPFVDIVSTIDLQIQGLEQDLTQAWEHSGDPNKTIRVEQGEIKIKAKTAVEIYNQTGLLRELVKRHSFDEVSGYINSFKKAQVRKFLTMFAVSPAVAEITTTHTATLTLRDDNDDESTRN